MRVSTNILALNWTILPCSRLNALNYPFVMGKRLAAVITTTLTATLFVIPAHSAVKAGSSCKKIGSISFTSTKKFTCVRSGKKLVWNKGVSLAPVAPKVQPTSTSISTPTPTPATTPTPTPTPTLSFPVSGSDFLLSLDTCRLSDSTGNNFHLGFPITPIIKDLKQISVFAIPFEFNDSENHRISKDQTSKMFESIARYYLRESYGRTKLEFTLPPFNDALGQIQALSVGVDAKDSPITKPFSYLDFVSYINQLLVKTPKSWNLASYDAVVLYSQDYRTFNFLGGQGWRSSENSFVGQLPFDSPSGKIRSLVFGSGIPTVMTHELGHSLFGFLDLYDQSAGQTFAQGWGLMASAYSGEMNLRGWEKWLAGWLWPEEVRCTKTNSIHYIEFVASQSAIPKLLILPIDSQKAVVVEAIDTTSIARENNGTLVFCDVFPSCQGEKKQGLLAYLIDVNKLSGLGPITVPEILKFPNLLANSKEILLAGAVIKNLGCDTRGCFISIKS